MDEDELRDVGDAVDRGDTITIGQVTAELTVTDRPIKDHTGALIFSAERANYPDEGIVTKVTISLGHPSSGETVEVSEYIMDESPETAVEEYQLGERREMNHYTLEQLSIIE